MSSQKDRIKKNIKGFLGYIEKRREHRKTFFNSYNYGVN